MNSLYVSFFFLLLFSACEVRSKKDVIILDEESKRYVDTMGSLDCGAELGDAMGDTIVGQDTIYGAWQDCYICIKDMKSAYKLLLEKKIKVEEDDFMYSILPRELPNMPIDTWYDSHQMGYMIKVNQDHSLKLELQYAGGLTDYTMIQKGDRIHVRIGYSAD